VFWPFFTLIDGLSAIAQNQAYMTGGARQGAFAGPIGPVMRKVKMQQRRPVMLAILDGWGWRDDPADNAVRQARTPSFDRLWSTVPHSLLHTSGLDVGLPTGQMGNSEVGHLNIGAGRVVMQDLPRITNAVETGELAKQPELVSFIAALKKSGFDGYLTMEIGFNRRDVDPDAIAKRAYDYIRSLL